MSFTGNEGEFVTLQDAARWTSNYRSSQNFDGVKAAFYGSTKLNTLINQRGCKGLRIYKGIDDAGLPVMVLVGVDANGNDITANFVLERGVGCPPNCDGNGSPLMG